jgi:hypothetical protein
MVTDRWLPLLELCGEVAHTQRIVLLHEQVEEPQAGWIGQRFESVGQ